MIRHLVCVLECPSMFHTRFFQTAELMNSPSWFWLMLIHSLVAWTICVPSLLAGTYFSYVRVMHRFETVIRSCSILTESVLSYQL